MTNPAWVVLFTKIVGLVTDAGGTVSHPAVLSREFGIPAVVGTSVATEQIKNGDRIRINGTTGVVEILGAAPARPLVGDRGPDQSTAMTRDAAISRSVLSDQVKDRLLQAILDGRYPPGARIVETRVARELGTSQAPVREALRDLEALGVVETTAFRGARVRRPSADELLEAFAIRAELESLGARLAIPRLTDEDLEDLAGYVDEMQRAADDGDTHAEATADAAFHGRIVELAGNATLERVWRTLEPFSRTYITIVVPGRRPAPDRRRCTPRSSTPCAAATRTWRPRSSTSTSPTPRRCSPASGRRRASPVADDAPPEARAALRVRPPASPASAELAASLAERSA